MMKRKEGTLMEPNATLITEMLEWARDIEPSRRSSPTPMDFPNHSEDEMRWTQETGQVAKWESCS